jgi:hypothetical protein
LSAVDAECIHVAVVVLADTVVAAALEAVWHDAKQLHRCLPCSLFVHSEQSTQDASASLIFLFLKLKTYGR